MEARGKMGSGQGSDEIKTGGSSSGAPWLVAEPKMDLKRGIWGFSFWEWASVFGAG
jgi:hypothetical protein